MIIALYLQMDKGLADNGDFTRVMTWFSSGPIGIEPNWPNPGTEAYSQRFFTYYLPYWKLDFPLTSKMFSSVLLLWLPGILLNWLFYSREVLYLPIMSILPRLLIIILLLTIFRWIEKNENNSQRRLLLYLTIGLLSTLMLTTTDYVAFLNSLYQETASFVFSMCLLLSFVLLRRKRSSWIFLVAGLLVLLLATAKTSNFYWPFIAIFFFVPFSSSLTRRVLFAIVAMGVAVAIVAVGFWVTRQGISPKLNEFNGLFYGVLPFSNTPEAHLSR